MICQSQCDYCRDRFNNTHDHCCVTFLSMANLLQNTLASVSQTEAPLVLSFIDGNLRRDDYALAIKKIAAAI